MTMIITHCRLNHLENPMGYEFSNPTISYTVENAKGKHQKSARVTVSIRKDFSELLYDSGERADIVSTAFTLPIALEPAARYYWKVSVTDEAGDTGESDVQWFETARSLWQGETWQAAWITPDADKSVQAVLSKNIRIDKPVKQARAYMTGLGEYEFYLNGEKQGNECLMPGYCDYDSWIQYQTYAIDLKNGDNSVEIILGDGWYKGNFGLNKHYENYGDRLAAIAEIHILYEDGTKEIIGTDESWQARRSRIVSTGIYCGEVYDATLDVSEAFPVRRIDLGYDRLSPRLSPPLTIHEHIKPIQVIHTPAGETVLDMGQNMVGWLQFRCGAARGQKIHLLFGEILQNDNFYNENLRTAKAEFTYISDGKERLVRPYFTFYGFRYVKVEGWEGELNPEDFEGLVIHSQMDERGEIITSDALVNQLVHNARWGMKGNFVDVPTDCPQRDERCGWTGDAQIFSGTASYFSDTYAFYAKYGKDMYFEQKKLGGSVPDIVPSSNLPGHASTAWADAATVIPWNVYLHSGDAEILRCQYASMKAWVDYMKAEDDKDGSRRLWLTGTHFADWLALDGNYAGGVYGATDPNYIASAYYFYSTSLTAKAAKTIGKADDAAYYANLADEIRHAFEREYFTPSGRLAVDTMTGYVVALYMGLVPDYALEKAREGLLNKLQKNSYHLETGFVGTPYLCRVLSENGMNDIAYHLLMEKGYPGWLYEVLMGATTIWERWNSVEPDGRMSGTDMNSLNHYSYGSIVEWMFRNMAGINPCEDAPGFKKIRLTPKPNYQIGKAEGRLRSASGLIVSAWEICGKELAFSFSVPFDACAEIVLPDADYESVSRQCAEQGVQVADKMNADGSVTLTADAGSYSFRYEPTVPCRKIYSLDSAWEELLENPKTREIIEREYIADVHRVPFYEQVCTLRELTWTPTAPTLPVTQEQRARIDKLLREVE